MSIQIKGILLAVIASLAALALAFTAATLFRPNLTASIPVADAREMLVMPPEGIPARQGRQLFMQNCAHCHGSDARGGEGPDLHGMSKTDQRITAIIENGIPGEMPKFSAKLNQSDIQTLIAFVRSLDMTPYSPVKSSQP